MLKMSQQNTDLSESYAIRGIVANPTGANPTDSVEPTVTPIVESPFNYRRLAWQLVLGVFLLFFLSDTIEHAVLPRLHLGHISWFFTTIIATTLTYITSHIVLTDLESIHRRLIHQNDSLASQAEALARESERLELAVQEAHHRIKNNLQTVAALLSWYDSQSSTPEEALQHAVARIRAIALVHDFLTYESAISAVNVGDVIQQLGHGLIQSMTNSDKIQLGFELEELYMPSNLCTSLALIVNELLLNALEHAFPQHRSGVINIILRQQTQRVWLIVEDNGAGLPADFDVEADTHAGLHIARSLAEEDLHGSFEIMSHCGTLVKVAFTMRENQVVAKAPL